MSNRKWICTDPNMNQWGRQIRDKIYEFKQDVKYPNGSIVKEKAEIDLNDYTDEEINNDLSPYSWSIKQLKEENNIESAEWLMAECIFEQLQNYDEDLFYPDEKGCDIDGSIVKTKQDTGELADIIYEQKRDDKLCNGST